ncbi:hypothetical protein [Saccharothrix sp. 6-C]|uniref:hypothetical protein n=1 Tax=Saccharothrix sp. 6-C TaxID=2781735 RepID=UPI001F1EA3DF|nr:hypothetical protein [Saccharothrix sp. 6-C]
MSEQPRQVSRVVLGFPRGRRVRRALAAMALLAAVAGLAPPWWWQAAVAAGRWAGRHWPVVVLVLVAGALSVGGRRHPSVTMLGRRPRTPAMPLLVHVALLLGSAAAIAAGAGVVLWDLLGQPTDRPQAPGAPPTPTWGVQERLDAVKVVLTVVGGVGAVVALTVAYRRQRLTEADSHREDTKVVLDRYTKAAELLGAADAPVRVAGVYAFAALANDAPDARQGCIDVLCAYLRQPYGTAADPGPHDPGQERQVRLTVIRLIRDNLHLADDAPAVGAATTSTSPARSSTAATSPARPSPNPARSPSPRPPSPAACRSTGPRSPAVSSPSTAPGSPGARCLSRTPG